MDEYTSPIETTNKLLGLKEVTKYTIRIFLFGLSLPVFAWFITIILEPIELSLTDRKSTRLNSSH